MKKLLICACLVAGLSNVARSETYVEGLIDQVSVGTTYARVKFQTMVTAESCANQSWYILSFQSGMGKEMYAAILAAKASGQEMRVQLNGCDTGYPSITHV
jgi:hypothetical protein